MARGRLREILAVYLNRDPRRIDFSYGARGKPATDGLKFNLSHSGGLAIYGITREREIGIDVEEIRAEIAHEQIAGRFFAPGELATIQAAPKSEQPGTFFRCWTRKEAYIKATRGRAVHSP